MESLVDRSATWLVRAIADRHVSAVEVFTAFRDRLVALEPLNALVSQRLDAAQAEAEAADRDMAHNRPLGMLHGLPVSIKEMFDVRGLPTTAGIQKLAKRRVTRDAAAVDRWRAAGAIVVGKANVPQLGIMVETDNPVYGQTRNPWNLQRGPGGSSGGDAALVAARGVPLALGSDGAGSIRQPAHACGICGFKPTGGRVTLQGHWLSANWPADWAQPGPIARCVDDLMLGWSAMQSTRERSAYGDVPVTHTKLGSDQVPDQDLRGVRFGVYEELEELAATPAVKRSVQEATQALAACGAEIVPVSLERSSSWWDLYTAIFYGEGLADLKQQVQGSPVDARVKQFFQLTRVPSAIRPMVAASARRAGQVKLARTLDVLRAPKISTGEYCRRLTEMQAARYAFSRWLDRHQLDALLAPANPAPAFPHDSFYANYSLMYTGIFNLLAVPAGVIPVTRVREGEESRGPAPRDWVERAIWQANADSRGLPIGVQIVGRWWQDETVLAMMKCLESALRPNGQPFDVPPDEIFIRS